MEFLKTLIEMRRWMAISDVNPSDVRITITYPDQKTLDHATIMLNRQMSEHGQIINPILPNQPFRALGFDVELKGNYGIRDFVKRGDD